jgi:hypothetical protein
MPVPKEADACKPKADPQTAIGRTHQGCDIDRWQRII